MLPMNFWAYSTVVWCVVMYVFEQKIFFRYNHVTHVTFVTCVKTLCYCFGNCIRTQWSYRASSSGFSLKLTTPFMNRKFASNFLMHFKICSANISLLNNRYSEVEIFAAEDSKYTHANYHRNLHISMSDNGANWPNFLERFTWQRLFGGL